MAGIGLVLVLVLALAGCAAPERPHGLLGLPVPEAPAAARGAPDGKGWLGLAVAEKAAGGLDEMADDAAGLAVEGVAPGGPAELAGIRAGDAVLALDGTPVRWRDAFEAREAALAAGSRAVLTVRRGEGVSPVALDVGARRVPRPLPPPEALVEERLAGIAVRSAPTATARALGLAPDQGVELLSFARESPWRGRGLEPGDVIVAARRAGFPAPPRAAAIFAPRELLDAIAAAGPGAELALDVARGGKRAEVEVPLRAPPRVRDVNLFYALRYERDGPATDAELLFYCFRYRSNPKETRLNFFWLLSFAWAGDEALTDLR